MFVNIKSRLGWNTKSNDLPQIQGTKALLSFAQRTWQWRVHHHRMINGLLAFCHVLLPKVTIRSSHVDRKHLTRSSCPSRRGAPEPQGPPRPVQRPRAWGSPRSSPRASPPAVPDNLDAHLSASDLQVVVVHHDLENVNLSLNLASSTLGTLSSVSCLTQLSRKSRQHQIERILLGSAPLLKLPMLSFEINSLQHAAK